MTESRDKTLVGGFVFWDRTGQGFVFSDKTHFSLEPQRLLGYQGFVARNLVMHPERGAVPLLDPIRRADTSDHSGGFYSRIKSEQSEVPKSQPGLRAGKTAPPEGCGPFHLTVSRHRAVSARVTISNALAHALPPVAHRIRRRSKQRSRSRWAG